MGKTPFGEVKAWGHRFPFVCQDSAGPPYMDRAVLRIDTYDLRGIQKAYDDFHSKLVAYNKRYTPHHVPEQLLNTPARLAAWCRSMLQLYLWVENYPQVQCPVHLLQKAYRWADRLSFRLNTHRAVRPTPQGTVRAAIQDLETLGQWCDDLRTTAQPDLGRPVLPTAGAEPANPAFLFVSCQWIIRPAVHEQGGAKPGATNRQGLQGDQQPIHRRVAQRRRPGLGCNRGRRHGRTCPG
jgi:hypothetical protein